MAPKRGAKVTKVTKTTTNASVKKTPRPPTRVSRRLRAAEDPEASPLRVFTPEKRTRKKKTPSPDAESASQEEASSSGSREGSEETQAEISHDTPPAPTPATTPVTKKRSTREDDEDAEERPSQRVKTSETTMALPQTPRQITSRGFFTGVVSTVSKIFPINRFFNGTPQAPRTEPVRRILDAVAPSTRATTNTPVHQQAIVSTPTSSEITPSSSKQERHESAEAQMSSIDAKEIRRRSFAAIEATQKPGEKRKIRVDDLDVIPSLGPGIVGIPTAFVYASDESSDDESNEQEEERIQAPPAKRVRFNEPETPSAKRPWTDGSCFEKVSPYVKTPIPAKTADPHRARPYTGTMFADKPATNGNIFNQSANRNNMKQSPQKTAADDEQSPQKAATDDKQSPEKTATHNKQSPQKTMTDDIREAIAYGNKHGVWIGPKVSAIQRPANFNYEGTFSVPDDSDSETELEDCEVKTPEAPRASAMALERHEVMPKSTSLKPPAASEPPAGSHRHPSALLLRRRQFSRLRFSHPRHSPRLLPPLLCLLLLSLRSSVSLCRRGLCLQRQKNTVRRMTLFRNGNGLLRRRTSAQTLLFWQLLRMPRLAHYGQRIAACSGEMPWQRPARTSQRERMSHHPSMLSLMPTLAASLLAACHPLHALHSAPRSVESTLALILRLSWAELEAIRPLRHLEISKHCHNQIYRRIALLLFQPPIQLHFTRQTTPTTSSPFR